VSLGNPLAESDKRFGLEAQIAHLTPGQLQDAVYRYATGTGERAGATEQAAEEPGGGLIAGLLNQILADGAQ
jgi:hypothetical protein